MKGTCMLWFATLSVTALAAAPALAASGHAATVPGCAAIRHAIQSAYDGRVSSVEDRTASVRALQAHGSAPYAVVRACRIHIAGHRIPLTVSIDAPVDRRFLMGMAKLAASTGRTPQKLDGAGYGDLAYLLPQYGGGYAVNALVGHEVLTIGNWASAKQTRTMARHIIALMH